MVGTITTATVQEAIGGLRSEFGSFHHDQWREAAAAFGLIVILCEAGQLDTPGVAVGGQFVIIRDDMEPGEMARIAWHEIAHCVLGHHDGIPVAEAEREAWAFADHFPS